METEKQNYEGKFVFIERIDGKSTYGNGEYFCVRQTPGNLYVTKLCGGYGGHNLEAKPLIGSEAWKVIESWKDDCAAEKGAMEMIAWGELIRDPNHKKQWIESVYSDCANNGRSVLRMLNKPKHDCVVLNSCNDQMVCVPAGTKAIVIKFVQ